MTLLLDSLRWLGILFLVLLLFNLVIVVHEWGHFLAARWRGLKIEKFQIWFGKPIWKKTINGVQYGLGTIPFGGFVALPQMADMTAIEGTHNPDGSPVEKLAKISPLDKIIVAFAGPLFSFLLAIVFAFIVWGVGKPIMQSEQEAVIGYVDSRKPAGKEGGLKVGDRVLKIDGSPIKSFAGPVDSVMWAIISAKNDDITFEVERAGQPLQLTVHAPPADDPEFQKWAEKSWFGKIFDRPPTRKIGIWYPTANIAVDKIHPNSPAELAGFKAGDVLRKLNGEPFTAVQKLSELVDINPKAPLQFEVQRGTETLKLDVTPVIPAKPANYVSAGGKGELGLESFKDLDAESKKVDGTNISHPTPYEQIHDSLNTTFSTLGALFSKSKVEAGHMSSAIGIINIYHKLFSIENGWMLILFFTVVLNVNLAVLNMLPVPVLDGGHITMALIESVARRPLRGKIVEYIQAGFAVMLLSFMVWVMLKDVGGMVGSKSEPLEFSPPAAAKAQ